VTILDPTPDDNQAAEPHPALQGPWQAVIADGDGFIVDIDRARLLWLSDMYVQIVVGRGTAIPVGVRMTESAATDVLYMVDGDLIEDEDDLFNRWVQAQAIAAALNALDGDAS
jgi:hypothetical protein